MRAATEIADAYVDDESRWRAVLARDTAADGHFVFAVTTTGVFCRPSCAARRPKRANVRFFTNGADAGRAGFRPCKRCHPLGNAPHLELAACIAAACRRIDTAETPPSLAELAAEAGLSPYYFHRQFKKFTGLTPKHYATAQQSARMREALPDSASVTDAIYAAGYSSSSRFYERADAVLGMPPSRYRNGGKGVAMQYAIAPCWLGLALVAATERGICAILFGDNEEPLIADLRERFPAAQIEPGDDAFAAMVANVLAAVEKPELSQFGGALDILGTAFQRRVWQALREIPAGETVTYTDIAQRIGAPKAVRAVASACAANPIGVVVPCHRVIRADGGLGGYRWGLTRKEKLLRRERGDGG